MKVSGIIQSIAGLVPSCCPASPECYCRRAFTRSQVEATQGWRDHELADERDTRAGHVLSGPGSCHLCPLPETCSSGDGCALARSIAGRLRSRPPAGSTRRSAPAPTSLVRGVRCVSSVESVRIPRFLLTFLHFFFPTCASHAVSISERPQKGSSSSPLRSPAASVSHVHRALRS